MGYVGLDFPSFHLLPKMFMKDFPKSSAIVGLIVSLFLSKWARKKSLEKCDCNTELAGKTVIITGGNSGVGKQTAMKLAWRNATVIIGCRNTESGSRVVEQIKTATGNQKVSCKELDLCSFSSIRKFVEEVKQTEKSVNILINNAGVISSGGVRIVTEDGCEEIMQTNYFGHFLLTLQLIDLMKKSKGRIINVTSLGHRWGSLDLKDLSSVKNYSESVYYKAKLANMLFTTELSKRLQRTGVTVNAVNPGFTNTRYLEKAPFFRGCMLKMLYMLYGKTPFEGAQTTIHVALSPELEGVSGRYFSNCKERKLAKAARDSEKAKELFETSEHVVEFKL